jgi:hypothetical protein
MDAFDHYKQLLSDAKYVEEAYTVLNPLAGSQLASDLARDLFTELISTGSGVGLEALRGSPTEWFNLATTAAQIDHTTAQRRILEVALTAHPEDVDLLCERFQFEYAHGSAADADNAWQRIEDLGEERTASYWRYWCYRSVFLARHRQDKATARQFLDRARPYVIPADLLQIFRNYRSMLIDGSVNPADPAGDLSEYDYLADEVQKKYREGLELGIENGYVLATDLARLLRERSAGKPKEEADRILDQALDLLDEAERLYTKSSNHPIVNIYIEKAITLMARRRYADALQIFRSLPSYRFERDESMQIMRSYASHMTGQPDAAGAPRGGGGSGDEGDAGRRLDQLENRLSQLEGVLMTIAQQTGLLQQQFGSVTTE